MSDNPFDLTGKVAIISGGNRGLGLGMALGLAKAGADIVIACRDQAKAAEAVAEIEGTGRRALAVDCDITSSASIDEAVAKAADAMGGLSILVNNSGTSCRFRPEETPEDEWDRVMDTNIKGAFMLSKAVHPYMKAAGGGKVINISSMYAIFGGANDSAYAASKGGLVQFTKVCAIAWADDNIQVNAILPGWFVTELTGSYLEQFPEQEKAITARTPAGRWGDPGDLAGTAVFLASSASDYITGASIAVDGGFSIKD
jgi:2-deoxy-D-gluconate 3-dehydrogenase